MKYDYREEAKTVEWQRKSGEIKERDDYTCFLCGSKDKFVHVHHRYYDGRLHYWEYPDDSLVTLCEDCHAEEHSISSDKNSVIINEAIKKAHNRGAMYLEIINAINMLFEKNSKRGSSDLEVSNIKISPNIRRENIHINPLRINERKQIFLKQLAEYGLKYEPEYLQSFADYWTDTISKKLRFENDPNFLMPTYLSKWKEVSDEVELGKGFTRLLQEALLYAKEQLEGYKDLIESIIKSQIEEIEQNEPMIKKRLLELFNPKVEEIKNTKMTEVIPSYKNDKTTVYEYLKRVSRPRTFTKIYEIDPNTETDIRLYVECQMHDFYKIKTYIGPETKIYPKQEFIDAIEKYFNITLELPVHFKKQINYVMNYNFYLKRQIYKYMIDYPDYNKDFLEEYKINNLITKKEFSILYEAKHAFLRNNEDNLKRLNRLQDILLTDFCKEANIEFSDIISDITLKTFLGEQSKYYELCPIQIRFSKYFYNQCYLEICIDFSREETFLMGQKISKKEAFLARILDKMNELYGFTFVVYHKRTQKIVHVPLEILARTNGYIFDFCTESFNNGTMTSVQLPDEFKVLDYYCNHINALINYKE